MSIKKHENIYLHIKRRGILAAIIKLPFNLILSILTFIFGFITCNFLWYGKSAIRVKDREKYDNFIEYLFGQETDDYEIVKKKKRRKKE